MITLPSEYHRAQVGVFGLGKAGEAAVSALLAAGADVYAWDDNEASRQRFAASMRGSLQISPPKEWPWAKLKELVLGPGVPFTHPVPHESVVLAHQHGCPVVGDLELLYRASPEATIICITGTNGKSTTTTLIGHILQDAGIYCQVGGNLGTPALDLRWIGKGEGVYVIEASSYQLDLIDTARFRVAVFLNITPDHLDRHGDMAGYVKAKCRMFANQQVGDTAVIAVDDEYTQAIAKTEQAKGAASVVTASAAGHAADIQVVDGMLIDGDIRIDLRSIESLTGQHNWQNAAVAYAAARAVGVAPQAIERAMRSFAGLRHRLQLVKTIRGVRFINDSKATNADATANALAPYRNIYWILGGKAKAGGISSLQAFFPHVAHAFLIGEAAQDFAATLEGHVPYTDAVTLEVAVQLAAAQVFADQKEGAVVLLSPACASFDQFKSFEHRGDVFCSLVEAIV
jgi:UDP-N-acetylmuramoylalanine--D-glutamate ligase